MRKILATFTDRALPVGKIPPGLLQRLLSLPRQSSPELLVSPGLGEDAAVLQLGNRLIAVGSDPITFPTLRPGFFAVHVNANDMAVTGATPRFFTLTMMLPPGATERLAAEIMVDAIEAAESVGAILIGGHSEVTAAVNIPLVSVTMFGELLCPEPLRTANGQPGDAVIQVNALAIEGTAILASEHRERLVRELGMELVDKAAGFLFDPGISVVVPARLVATRLAVHAMHDPTEGGIATGLREIAAASGTGVVIKQDGLLMAEETRQICEVLGCDPLGIISSGCLLFTIEQKHAAAAVNFLGEAGFAAARIGFLDESPHAYIMKDAEGVRKSLPEFAVDELASGIL